MSSTKTRTLTIFLLTIICSSTFIQAREQLGAPPPKSVDMALPQDDDYALAPVDYYALSPVDGSLFDFGKIPIFGPIFVPIFRPIFGKPKAPSAPGVPGVPSPPGGIGKILGNPGLFACMTPFMSMGSCMLSVGRGILHHPKPDFHHIGRPCCEKVLTPGTMQCIVGIMTKSFLVSMVPLPVHIKALEKACKRIPNVERKMFL
ncbi:hypothetical protein ACFE04_007857 [Oxalis oulophora]